MTDQRKLFHITKHIISSWQTELHGCSSKGLTTDKVIFVALRMSRKSLKEINPFQPTQTISSKEQERPFEWSLYILSQKITKQSLQSLLKATRFGIHGEIHGEMRKRGLVDVMHKLGLCISYNRVMDISTDLANSVTAQFEQNGVVCPLKV